MDKLTIGEKQLCGSKTRFTLNRNLAREMRELRASQPVHLDAQTMRLSVRSHEVGEQVGAASLCRSKGKYEVHKGGDR
jgi:hypothetical protein